MIDALRWLIVIELIGLAFLPLTVWLFRWLPDRGYVLAKILGLLLVTYAVWLLGNFVPIGDSAVSPVIVILLAGALGWWFWKRETSGALVQNRRVVVIEEVLFLAAFVSWTLLRAHVFGPSINHTEQPMDMTFLNSSIRSASYPPFDPWMSGHSINYYYFGYLMFGTLIKLSAVAPWIGYNLSISLIFALTVGAAYSLGYALTRRLSLALLAPGFLALLGNWHAFLWELPHRGCAGVSQPGFYGQGQDHPYGIALWNSTRVVGGNFTLTNWHCNIASFPTNYTTINEYPLFSFVLGDLHPHLMALPVVLLALAIAANFLFSARLQKIDVSWRSFGYIALLGVCLGSLFTINSWDYPTYTLIVIVCVGAIGYISEPSPSWWKNPLKTSVALGAASLLLYIPFYVHFQSLAQGIGLVSTPSDLFEFVQVFGFYLMTTGFLLAALAILLKPAGQDEQAQEEDVQRQPAAGRLGVTAERGQISAGLVLTLAVVVVLGGVLHRWVLLADLGMGMGAIVMLNRVLNTEHPNRRDALALVLVAVAALVLAFTEVIYLRDGFDNGSNYRMNTVFKFYYQAWILLALAGAYGTYRGWQILRSYVDRSYAWIALVAIVAGTLGAGIYTAYIPAYTVDASGIGSLDGIAWLKQAQPDDYAGIMWLRLHVHGTPVELEATGGEFTTFGRVATFTGLPTVMGWAGHELQWRINDSDINVRARDVNTIFTTRSAQKGEALLRKYNVRYVFVGTLERQQSAGYVPRLQKFSHFMKVVFHSGSTTIYMW